MKIMKSVFLKTDGTNWQGGKILRGYNTADEIEGLKEYLENPLYEGLLRRAQWQIRVEKSFSQLENEDKMMCGGIAARNVFIEESAYPTPSKLASHGSDEACDVALEWNSEPAKGVYQTNKAVFHFRRHGAGWKLTNETILADRPADHFGGYSDDLAAKIQSDIAIMHRAWARRSR